MLDEGLWQQQARLTCTSTAGTELWDLRKLSRTAFLRSWQKITGHFQIFCCVTNHGLILDESELNHGFAVKNHTTVCNMEIIYAGNLQVK